MYRKFSAILLAGAVFSAGAWKIIRYIAHEAP